MSASSTAPVERLSCRVCVIGAGIAGLNAACVAAQYLSATDTIVLVDSNAGIGGMWRDTYDYVRLHQPHPMFTAGNVPWSLAQPPEYLATKDEVLAHFANCIEHIASRVNLVLRFGYRYVRHDETPKTPVRITCRGTGSGTPDLEITADSCIKAFGFRIETNDPLPLTSRAVHSVSPHDAALAEHGAIGDGKPVYVIGGGKTGMDTAHTLITRYPDTPVHLLVGRGTVFYNRDVAFPIGARRYWAGRTGITTFMDITQRFDGTNEREVFRYFRQRYTVRLDDTCEYYVLGILSPAENQRIREAAREIAHDYLEDVIDTDGMPELCLRSGARRPVAPGSWFVNCTGYVLRREHRYEPFVSPCGRVVSVQPGSAIHILTTFAAYFLTHLHFLGRLRDLPLYEMDLQALAARDKAVFPFACMSQIMYNVLVIMDAAPVSVFSDCALDFDRWFPAYRRMYAVMKLRRHRARYRAHLRDTLDRVQQRYGIRCGPLAHV